MPERPLRQRRGDLPGGRRDARAHRRQGEAERQPKAKYFEKAGATKKYDTSFNLLGWTPGSFDSWNVLANIVGCRDANGKRRRLQLRRLLQSEGRRAGQARSWSRPTPTKRDELIARGLHASCTRRPASFPLHQQALVWGVSKKVKIVQRADNQILFYWVADGIDCASTRDCGRGDEPRLVPAHLRQALHGTDARLRHPPSARSRHGHADGRAAGVRAVPLRRRSDQPDGRPGHQPRGPRCSCASSSASTIRSRCSSAASSGTRARFDFGISYQVKQPVTTLIAERFPATMELAFVAALFAIAARHSDGRLHRHPPRLAGSPSCSSPSR